MPNQRDISDAENDLYIKEGVPQVRARRPITTEPIRVPRSWDANQRPKVAATPKKKTPVLLWFFLASCGFALLAFIMMTFSLFGSGRAVTNQNIDIEILGKSFAEGGEQLEFEVLVKNKNNASLELADLVLQYPESGGNSTRVHEERRALDTVAARSERSEKFTAQLYGSKDATIPVTARLEYRVASSRSIFVKEYTLPVVLRSSPLSLTITGSDQVAQNQQATFTITINSQSSQPLSNTALRVDYPEGFVPTQYSVQPDVGKNVWKLGDILAGEKKIIEVTGQLRGAQVNQALSIRAYVGQQESGNERSIGTLYASESKQLTVAAAFLGTNIIINGNTGDTVAVSSGADISGVIRVQNVTGSRIRDVEITAELSGGLYDPASVNARGAFYDSNKNRIVWNRSTGSRANLMDPNQTETLDFDMEQLASGSGTMSIVVSIKGIGVDGSVYEVKNVDSVVIKRAVALSLSKSVAGSSGPIPPTVGQETVYAVTMTIGAPTANLSQTTVTTQLPGYVVWKNQVNPSNQSLTYQSGSGQLTWKAGDVPAGQPRTVTFMLGVTPSVSQARRILELTDDIRITAVDSQSGAMISSAIAGADSRVSDNPADGTVVNSAAAGETI